MRWNDGHIFGNGQQQFNDRLCAVRLILLEHGQQQRRVSGRVSGHDCREIPRWREAEALGAHAEILTYQGYMPVRPAVIKSL